MESSIHRTAVLQVVISVVVGMFSYALQGEAEAKAALYGGVVALMGTLLLLWRMQRCKQKTLLEARQHLWLFYRSGLERFLVICVLLAIGMGAFKLVPLAILVGFVAGQLAWIIAPLKRKRESKI